MDSRSHGVRSTDGQLPEGLDGVGVERHAGLTAARAHLVHRLDGTHFVVRPHHADHARPGGQRLVHGAEVHDAVLVHTQHDEVRALRRRTLGRRAHRLVLHRRAHHDTRAWSGTRPARRPPPAQDGDIVRFRPAAREDDVAALRTERRRQPRARVLQRIPRLAAPPVHARRVAEPLIQVRRHGVTHFRADGRRCGMVEVYGLHWHGLSRTTGAAPRRLDTVGSSWPPRASRPKLSP
jgi:hypothetical protein